MQMTGGRRENVCNGSNRDRRSRNRIENQYWDISVVSFSPRDAMHSADCAVAIKMPVSPSVRPSVRLSVTCRCSVETAKCIFNFFTIV